MSATIQQVLPTNLVKSVTCDRTACQTYPATIESPVLDFFICFLVLNSVNCHVGSIFPIFVISLYGEGVRQLFDGIDRYSRGNVAKFTSICLVLQIVCESFVANCCAMYIACTVKNI